jgi:hypothetical protein
MRELAATRALLGRVEPAHAAIADAQYAADVARAQQVLRAALTAYGEGVVAATPTTATRNAAAAAAAAAPNRPRAGALVGGVRV